MQSKNEWKYFLRLSTKFYFYFSGRCCSGRLCRCRLRWSRSWGWCLSLLWRIRIRSRTIRLLRIRSRLRIRICSTCLRIRIWRIRCRILRSWIRIWRTLHRKARGWGRARGWCFRPLWRIRTWWIRICSIGLCLQPILVCSPCFILPIHRHPLLRLHRQPDPQAWGWAICWCRCQRCLRLRSFGLRLRPRHRRPPRLCYLIRPPKPPGTPFPLQTIRILRIRILLSSSQDIFD